MEVSFLIMTFSCLQKLDSGQEYAITAGQLNENKAKNRYANIIACKNNVRH